MFLHDFLVSLKIGDCEIMRNPKVGGPCVDLRFIETSQIAFLGAVLISFTGGFYAVASAESMQAHGIGAMAPVQ